MAVNKNKKRMLQKGTILIYEVVVMFIFSLVMVAVIGTAAQQLRAIRASINREQALQIAEAGVNYYQWRLAHYPNDYQDGTGVSGPYIHVYKDADTQQNIGEYSLQIAAPPNGSTIVTITSTGYTYANPNVRRTITTRYGIPSLAQYAFLTNGGVWIGNTESVSGLMHSNNGIRFDGTGNAPITSAKQTYTCFSWQGSPCPVVKNGIWGAAPQATQNFWSFPVPAVDFSAITSNLASMKALAQQPTGLYLPPSNTLGYSLVFNSNGTVTVYKVTTLRSTPTGYDVNGVAHNEDLDYLNRVLQFTQALPTNGIIYIEDKTWVEGTVNGKAMVAAAVLPYNASTAPSIYIPNNINYLARDGNHVLGLLAQKDIVVTYRAPNVLNIDAALIAQNSSAQFFYFPGAIKTSISLYGSLMSFGTWTWSWVDGSGNTVSGYPNTSTSYDSNLLYSPPPSFPLSASGYQQITWTSN